MTTTERCGGSFEMSLSFYRLFIAPYERVFPGRISALDDSYIKIMTKLSWPGRDTAQRRVLQFTLSLLVSGKS